MEELARHLVELRLDRVRIPITSSQWSRICQLHRLRHLRIVVWDRPGGIQAITEEIAGLAFLQTLDIQSYDKDDEDYPPEDPLLLSPALAHLSRLTELKLKAAGGDCLHLLCSLSSLRKLTLKAIAGNGLDIPGSLTGLQGLEHLTVKSYFVVLGHMQALGDLQSLQSLHIEYAALLGEDRHLQAARISHAIGCQTNLTYLYLEHCDLKPSLSDLQCLTGLRELSLCALKLRSFGPAPHWPYLKELDLTCNKMKSLPDLQNLTSLEALDLGHQSRDFQIHQPLEFLQHMPMLQTLDLGRSDDRGWSPQSLVYLEDAVRWQKSGRNRHLMISSYD